MDEPDIWEPWTPKQRAEAQEQRRKWRLLVACLYDDELNIDLYDVRRVMPTFEMRRRDEDAGGETQSG